MYKLDDQVDPVVEILRLAYRRGLAVLREQAKAAEQIAGLQVDGSSEKGEEQTEASSTDPLTGAA